MNAPALGSPFEAELDGPFDGRADVEGALPSWLRGRLLRSAPALFEVGGWAASHWFDGFAMLYRLDLGDDGVRFAQRLLECGSLDEARRGRLAMSTFATPNQRSLWRRIFEPIPKMTDNANVHVVPTPDGWLAMTETETQLLIDGETLKTRRAVRYDDAVGKGLGMLAHPERDGRALVNLAFKIGPRAEIIAYRQLVGSYTREPIGKISLPELPYIHAFGLTPTKIVIVAPPLLAKPTSMLWSNAGYIDHFRWRPERTTRIFTIDRATGASRVVELESFFMFHTLNAYDDGGDVVVDVSAYRDTRVIDRLRMETLRDEFFTPTELVRLRVPAKGGRATRATLDRESLEFPTVNRAVVGGRRHRLAWGTALGVEAGRPTSRVRRLDLESGASSTFRRDDVVYGEPVFVRRPRSTIEDDGVLLVVGSDVAKRRAELVILDARSLEPVATARLPIALPLGFHGSFARERV